MQHKSRNAKILALMAVIMAAILLVVTANTGLAQEPAPRPAPASPDVDRGAEAAQTAEEGAMTTTAAATKSAASCVTVFQDGGDRLAALQNDDGGWDWPLDDGNPANSSPLNTVGPIAMGLAQAYLHTGDGAHLVALQQAGTFLLAKTNNFSPSDGYLAAQLDAIFGGTTYVDHVMNNYYGPLAAGTYDRNGAGTLYDTAGYVSLIRTARANQGIPNLAAWDIGMGLVGAAASGADTSAWVAGLKAEIDELDGNAYYDVIGLAGAVYGLAYVGEDYNPTAGQHASASSLADLADTLAGYQIDGGGFTWNMNYLVPNDDNETIQETAYAVLALDAFDPVYYASEIQGAADYMKSVQLTTGGWKNWAGAGENNEITGEALWGISVTPQGPVSSDVLANPNPVAVGGTSLATATVDNSVSGCASIASAEYSLDGGTTWLAMDAADGVFDEINEGVEATYTAPAEAGIYDLCVQGTDAADNTGAAECTMLVVYDPDGGFVTGGGWIDSPEGAYVGPEEFQVKCDQPFETGTDGWFDNDDYAGYGDITASGGTAIVLGSADDCPSWVSNPTTCYYGPFSRFDGYHDVWPGTWIAELDVYLDPTWASGEGFDYSVAASGSDGNHQRDYIFHVGVVENYGPVTGKALLVNGSNNTDFYPNPYKLVNDNGGNYFEVATAGWYTLQHVFYDAGGYLAVDLNLLDGTGAVLWTANSSSTADTIPGEVGGNRYSWFTHATVANGIEVDNHQRFEFGPTYPTGRANFGFVSKYKKGADTPTGSTEFVFQAADLNFHSNDYDWLVVNQNGTNAQFKGRGTLNGVEGYQFMLWATDDAPDTFRIKIWEETSGDVVYDNGMDQAIGGGNIVVHSGKK